MLNLIHGDLYKMKKSPTIKILFLLTLFCSLASISIAYLISRGKMDTGISGIGFLFSDANVMTILGAVAAGTFICSDFDNKTIHETITCGCGRRLLVLSKALAFFFTLLCLLLPYVLITCAALASGSTYSLEGNAVGFLNLVAREAGSTFSASLIPKTFAVILALGATYLAQLSVCIPLAFLIRKPVVIVAVNYVITILNIQLNLLTAKYSLLNKVYALTPFGGNYQLLTLDASSYTLVKSFLVSFLFIAIMLLITFRVFRKAEIK